jgi:hypothetical protein
VKPALVPLRLRPQWLTGDPLPDPAAVVAHLGAVQSQDHAMSLWSVGRRCGATLAEVEESFERADFVRTHVMRGTWHHVLAADLTDFLEVTTQRSEQMLGTGNRMIGLSDQHMHEGADLVTAAVVADGPLTRPELAERLEDTGLEHSGTALAHIVMYAEVTGQIVSGPMRGKRHTYVTAKLPLSRRTPDERLAWIAQTYARGHGPFQARDLAWWTSLTLTQARRAVELSGLRTVDIGGKEYFADHEPEPVDVPRAMLLSNFDELISYVRDPDDLDHLGTNRDTFMRSGGHLFVDGRLDGFWRRSTTKGEVAVSVTSMERLDGDVLREIEAEADAFGRFCERTPTLDIVRQPA